MRLSWQHVGIACFVVLLLGISDTLYKAAVGKSTVLRVMAGGETAVSGDLELPLDEVSIEEHSAASSGATALGDYLGFESSSKSVDIEFQQLRGRFWRGVVRVAETAGPGVKTFRVFIKGQPRPEHEPLYTLRVFREPALLRADLDSVTERWLGVQPWWTVVVFLPLGLWCMYQVYLQAGREDERLIRAGMGPIYKLAKRKQSWEIIFGLGSRQGVSEGERLVLLDREGRPVGHLFAIKVGAEASHATLDAAVPVTPDHLVAREGAAPRAPEERP